MDRWQALAIDNGKLLEDTTRALKEMVAINKELQEIIRDRIGLERRSPRRPSVN